MMRKKPDIVMHVPLSTQLMHKLKGASAPNSASAGRYLLGEYLKCNRPTPAEITIGDVTLRWADRDTWTLEYSSGSFLWEVPGLLNLPEHLPALIQALIPSIPDPLNALVQEVTSQCQ